MAIEKKIDLEEELQPTVPIPTNATDVTATPDGGAEITLTDQQQLDEAEAMGLLDEEQSDATQFDSNLAEFMNEADIQKTASDLEEGFVRDKNSREEYDEIAEDGIKLLGLQYDDSAGSFPGSAGVTHPVLAQAVVKFQAKAYK